MLLPGIAGPEPGYIVLHPCTHQVKLTEHVITREAAIPSPKSVRHSCCYKLCLCTVSHSLLYERGARGDLPWGVATFASGRLCQGRFECGYG
jgi:hypothetical protein